MHCRGHMIPEDLDEKIKLSKSEVSKLAPNLCIANVQLFLQFISSCFLSERVECFVPAVVAIKIHPSWPCKIASSPHSLFCQGAVPFLVSCTSGSTVQGAFDPLDHIADVCEKHNLWMHVDVSRRICVCVFSLLWVCDLRRKKQI